MTGEELDVISRDGAASRLYAAPSNVMEPHDYARFESWQDDPHTRKWNLWGMSTHVT